MTNELYHHGIKGQRWGVRRYQNSDGSLTEAGEKRYQSKDGSPAKTGKNRSISSKAEQKLSDYLKKNRYLTDDEAQKAAKAALNRTAKILAITAGVGLAVYVGSKAYQKGYLETDRIIKSGDTIQTLTHDPQRMDKAEQFFTNFMQGDKQIYEGRFGGGLSNPKYRIQMPVMKDMKIASEKSGEKVFKDLMKNNSEFSAIVKSEFKSGKYNPVYKKGYHLFNAALMPQYDNETIMKANNIFYEAMKNRGYSGVIDVNDTRYSHLRGHSPTFMFDRSGVDLTKVTIDTLSKSDIKAGREYALKAIPKLELRQIRSGDAVKKVATIGAIAGMRSAMNSVNKNSKNAVVRGRKDYIDSYKKYKNIDLSGLSDKELDKIMRSRKLAKSYGLKNSDRQRWYDFATNGIRFDYKHLRE